VQKITADRDQIISR